MSTFSLPQPPTAFAIRLLRLRNALLPCDVMGRTSGFGAKLSPVTSSAPNLRAVSCYALFEWWPLLSLHPACLKVGLSFHVELGLEDLIAESGLFPSPLRTLALAVRLPHMIGTYSEFGWAQRTLRSLRPSSALPRPKLVRRPT